MPEIPRTGSQNSAGSPSSTPYDDPEVIRGQGTIAVEVLAAQPELDALVVPIGGGGLIAGNAVAAKGIRPQLEIIGVEAARFPTMRQALAGEPPADIGPRPWAAGAGARPEISAQKRGRSCLFAFSCRGR
jgi:threonine dehydratase